jgi:hypothetical protein
MVCGFEYFAKFVKVLAQLDRNTLFVFWGVSCMPSWNLARQPLAHSHARADTHTLRITLTLALALTNMHICTSDIWADSGYTADLCDVFISAMLYISMLQSWVDKDRSIGPPGQISEETRISNLLEIVGPSPGCLSIFGSVHLLAGNWRD